MPENNAERGLMTVSRLMLTALGLLAVSATPCRAEADGPDFFKISVIAAGKVLNMRSGPGVAHAKVGIIPAGTDGIANLGCTGGLTFGEWQNATERQRKAATRSRWCHVRFEGIEGWVAGRFLTEGSGLTHADLAGTAWKLVGTPAGPAIGDAWLSISVSGDVTGNSGCNGFFASGRFDTGVFKLGSPIGSTKRLCPEPGLMEQEAALFSALERAAAYDANMQSGSLFVMDATDETLLEFASRP